jgi:hypothetical protein
MAKASAYNFIGAKCTKIIAKELLQPIIRRLFGNDHIMDVAFAHAGGTDL